MTTTYTTADGDMLDEIAWKYYGTTDGSQVEAVLLANQNLADLGPVLPAGVIIVMPDASSATQTTQGVKLWD